MSSTPRCTGSFFANFGEVTISVGFVSPPSRVIHSDVIHPDSGLRERIHDRQSLREAIVLAELLGPPVSLRESVG